MGCGVLIQDRYVQDERYFAIEHMDVRREASRRPHMCLASPEARHHTPVAADRSKPNVLFATVTGVGARVAANRIPLIF